MRRFNFSVLLLLAAFAPGRAFAQSYQQELSDSIKPSGTADNGTTDQRMIQVAGSNANTALKILTDASGNLTTVPAAGAAATPVNLTQVNTVAVSVGSGVVTANTPRVTLPTDVNVPVNAAQVNGAAIQAGSGVVGTGTQRVTLATDVALPTGANTIGAVDVRVGGAGATGGTGVVGASTQRVTLATDVALPTGANVIGALSANQSVNEAQINGVAPTMGNGIAGVGVQRVTLASDSTGQVTLATGANTIGALSANQSVNEAQINGVAPTMNNGIAGAGVQRVTIASDSTGQVSLATGANTIGALTANQSVNVAQMNGVATTMGSGPSGTGVQRVILATDQPVIPVSDNSGSLTVDAVASSFAAAVSGDVASGSADSGSPVKVGLRALDSAPTPVTANQRVNAWGTLAGAARTSPIYSTQANIANVTANNTCNVVKGSAGILHKIIVGTTGTTANFTIWNKAAAPCNAGQVGGVFDANSLREINIDSTFTNGILINTNAAGAAADMTVIYE